MTDGEIIKWLLIGITLGGAMVHLFWCVWVRDEFDKLGSSSEPMKD